MDTQEIWNRYSDELYFFILKKVNCKNMANDILQNVFLKIHKNLSTLKEIERVKGWAFQIARNEIANNFIAESRNKKTSIQESSFQETPFACCFDKLINELPDIYREVIEMVYIEGKKQKNAAIELGISVENTKARIRRAKDMLKDKFQVCCKYELNEQGKLVGEANCASC